MPAVARSRTQDISGFSRPAFTFLYFCLITSKFIYFQCEARCSEHSQGMFILCYTRVLARNLLLNRQVWSALTVIKWKARLVFTVPLNGAANSVTPSAKERPSENPVLYTVQIRGPNFPAMLAHSSWTCTLTLHRFCIQLFSCTPLTWLPRCTTPPASH